MTTSVFWASDGEQYAGFWSRFGAQILDAFIALPFVALRLVLFRTRLAESFAFVPLLLFEFWFSVYLVYRYGGTPGKLIMGIRITSTNGEPLSFRQAVLRDSPSLVLGAVGAISIAIALSQVSDATFEATSWIGRPRLLAAFMPHWNHYVSIVAQVWTWSELVVMLTNPERRALHDFLAGTIVIKREYLAAGDDPSLLPSSPDLANAILKP